MFSVRALTKNFSEAQNTPRPALDGPYIISHDKKDSSSCNANYGISFIDPAACDTLATLTDVVKVNLPTCVEHVCNGLGSRTRSEPMMIEGTPRCPSSSLIVVGVGNSFDPGPVRHRQGGKRGGGHGGDGGAIVDRVAAAATGVF